MTRLTKKYEDGSGYEPIETHNVCNVNLYDFNYNDYECCIDKLGKIEDIMEKYNIKSLKKLEKIISQGITYNDFIKSSWKQKGEKTNGYKCIFKKRN